MVAGPVTSDTGADKRHLPYMPGIDGLRAIAVLSVMFYHSNPDTMIGGFLGVEVFFVISGYLITSLLLNEFAATGSIDLIRFWIRRARRLLPALFLLLGVVIAYAALFLPDQAARMRIDIAAAVGYVTNWQLIFQDISYFEFFGRPPVLRHLWSLAIEEQFYLVWPLAFLAIMTLLKRPRRLAAIALVFAIGSAALMWLLFEPAVDPSRVYYGTDTRAAGLLVGVILAALWRPWTFRLKATPRGRVVLDVIGFVALAVMLAFLFFVTEFSAFLYQGGFPLLDVVTALVIAVCAYPKTRLGWLLGNPLFLWVGTRSYGIYLWHWPVFMVTRPGLDIALDGLALWALRFGLTFGIAELSYRYIEAPIRRGSLAGWLRDLRVRVLAPWKHAASTPVVAVAVAALLVAGSGLAELSAPEVTEGEQLQAELESIVAAAAPTTTLAATTTQPPRPADTLAAPTTTLPEPVIGPGVRITAIGDSVMLGATPILRDEFGDAIAIDADINRKMRAAIPVVGQMARADSLGADIVVIHLGNNAVFSSADFDGLMEAVGSHPNVVFFTVKVPRPWEGPVNRALREGVARWDNARLVDWNRLSSGRPEYFKNDGIHLAAEGMRAYAQLIREHM